MFPKQTKRTETGGAVEDVTFAMESTLPLLFLRNSVCIESGKRFARYDSILKNMQRLLFL